MVTASGATISTVTRAACAKCLLYCHQRGMRTIFDIERGRVRVRVNEIEMKMKIVDEMA